MLAHGPSPLAMSPPLTAGADAEGDDDDDDDEPMMSPTVPKLTLALKKP